MKYGRFFHVFPGQFSLQPMVPWRSSGGSAPSRWSRGACATFGCILAALIPIVVGFWWWHWNHWLQMIWWILMVPNDVHHIFFKMMFMECSDSSFSKALPPLEGHPYLLLLTDAKVGRRTGHDHSSPWKLQYWALNPQPQNIRLLVISEIYILVLSMPHLQPIIHWWHPHVCWLYSPLLDCQMDAVVISGPYIMVFQYKISSIPD